MGHNPEVITSIEIENFRGIREGRLDGLAPLTILTGPNGCGKSSVLDALLIGASPTPGDAIGRALLRHPQGVGGWRWLFLDRYQPASLRLSSAGPESNSERQLIWVDPPEPAKELEALARKQAPGPYRQISCLAAPDSILADTFVAFDNRYEVRDQASDKPVPFVRFIDSSIALPLDRSFSEVWRQGKREELIALIQPLVPDLQSIDILTEDNGSALLYLTRKRGAIPVSLSGDGVQALVQIALDLALVIPDGLALIEEPEVFLHRRAIYQCAQAVVSSVRQGRQIVLATHSLEFIDALLGYCEDDKQLALFNLRLSENKLESVKWVGSEARYARDHIEEDLR